MAGREYKVGSGPDVGSYEQCNAIVTTLQHRQVESSIATGGLNQTARLVLLKAYPYCLTVASIVKTLQSTLPG